MGGGNSRELTGTTSGCTAHHTPVRWRLCAVKQLELIPGPLNSDVSSELLEQWTWDQTDP